MRGVEEERSQGERNAEAYRQGMRDAAAGTNFGRPSRRYPAAEEQGMQEEAAERLGRLLFGSTPVTLPSEEENAEKNGRNGQEKILHLQGV